MALSRHMTYEDLCSTCHFVCHSAPDVALRLQRVYGHNASFRHNIHYGKGRSVVYPAGTGLKKEYRQA